MQQFLLIQILIILKMMDKIIQISYALMERESDYDNDGLDPSEEYFRKKKKGNDEDAYFPPEESEPPHY